MRLLRLKRNWLLIVRKAWSVKFMVLAFLLTAAEVALPFFDNTVPPGIFAAMSALATAGAFVSRLMAQQEVKDD